jgi:hypothetical protein
MMALADSAASESESDGSDSESPAESRLHEGLTTRSLRPLPVTVGPGRTR